MPLPPPPPYHGFSITHTHWKGLWTANDVFFQINTDDGHVAMVVLSYSLSCAEVLGTKVV